MRHTSPLLPLLCLGLAATAGCGEDFDPYHRVQTLRVLAMKSEPATPGPGETALLTPLTYAPAGETLSYEWSWCPAPGPDTQGHPCLLTEPQVEQLLGGADVPSFALGTGPTATLTHAIPEETLASLCSDDPQVRAQIGDFARFLDCEGGFAVQIKLVVRSTKDGQQTDELTAVRTLRLRYGQVPPNANPVLDGLAATNMLTPITEDNAADVTLARNDETLLRAMVNPDLHAETYMGKNDDLKPAVVRERLILSWFVETGDLEFSRTTFIEGQVPIERATRNEWEPDLLKDYERPTARLIVVLRDSRGGVDWRSGVVNLEAK